MCQTAIISKDIARVSTRGYRQNVEALAGEPLRLHKLSRLNNSLDSLYQLLHDQFNTIRKEDYAQLGPQLSLLLTTIKDLHKTYRRLSDSVSMKRETKRLSANYSALFELDSDIRNYRLRQLPAPLTASLTKAASLLNTL